MSENLADIPISIEKSDTKKNAKFSSQDIQVIFIILLLMFINTASLNMLIPSYNDIMVDFHVANSVILIPDSLSVLISAFVSVVWGYYTDRLDRNKVINGGAFLSAIGFIFTAFCDSFSQLLAARILTGAGMGFVMPVGVSILSDIIPEEDRSGWFGFLAIYSSISNAAGQYFAAFLGPYNPIEGTRDWQFPFLFLSALSILAVILLIFIKIPDIGSKEESLDVLRDIDEMEYGYQINKRELLKMLKKPTNKFLILNGFFTIIPGTILIFTLTTTLADSSQGMLAVLPDDIRKQVSTLMAGLVGVGYMIGNVVLSYVGDKVYTKNKRNRALLGLICNIIAYPFIMLMVSMLKPIGLDSMPVYPEVIPEGEITSYIIDTIVAIFTNYPNYVVFFIFSFIGSFFSAGFVSNKNAIMVDVNLPEHRGTATSFFQLTEQIGKSVTLMMVAIILGLVGTYKNMMYIGVSFWIPSAIFWYLSSRTVITDLNEKAMILRERAQESFIDYFFELEIAIDDGVQKIQDAKDILLQDHKTAENNIDRAINKFKWILLKSRNNPDMADLEQKAEGLLNNALLFKGDLLMLSSHPKEEELKQLFGKIDTVWEESDFGKIEVLYESAYLKVCEARLRRNYNPVESVLILQDAIDVYDRVIRLTGDRVVDEGVKKLSPEEEEMQARIHDLLINAQKSKSNTLLLKEKLDQIVGTVLDKNITDDQLSSMIELTTEYGLKLQDIVMETFEGKTSREVKKVTEDIDDLFQAYDDWMDNE